MISLKSFLDRSSPEPHRDSSGQDHDLVEAAIQMGRLLLDTMATHVIPGREADSNILRRRLNGLAHKMEGPQTAMALLGISSDAAEAFETYCQRTTTYLLEEHEERQAMHAMLTDTIAELSGRADTSVARLQVIEKQVEQASELNDIRTLRANLGVSLRALRAAAADQRSSSAATVARLQDQIATAQQRGARVSEEDSSAGSDVADVMPEALGPVEPVSTSYVAAFRLQRAEQIANRYGETAKHQMLTAIATQLKTMLGPNDRLLRWKGTSFVLFMNSTAGNIEIKARLAETVAATCKQYIEVGKKSALLSVDVDWIVFPQADRPLDAVFAEVERFLANAGQTPR
jgi:GGDEF domain-containing protein